VTDRTPAQNNVRLGAAAGIGAYVLWGILPTYVKAVSFANVYEVLGNRMLWTLPSALVVVFAMSGWQRGRQEIAAALKPRTFAALSLCGFLLFLNWGTYLWSVVNHHLMEAALAYFLAPLMQVLVGVLFFKEKLRPVQLIAIGFAVLGVIAQGVALGAPPWIGIIICVTWVMYAGVRKFAPVPAAPGLFVETLALVPIALAILYWLSRTTDLKFDDSLANAALLALAGPATAAPLILFVIAVRRISFSTLGVLQYIAPLMQFSLAVMFGEPLGALRIISFVLIWVALIAFTWDSFASHRAGKSVQAQA
jgi:chloramphenicol-sensitive protein RarD